MTDTGKETSGKKTGKLEIVLKSDSAGTVEAVLAALSKITVPGVDINVIRSGVGDVNRSDVLLAATGSRLIIGFQVDVHKGVERALKEDQVEVRLYNVIYLLVDDLKGIAESLTPSEQGEEVIGSGKVIALFKSSRRGIIVGCEVLEGFLAPGQHFRIVSAMGPVYSGIIESLHIGEKAVQKAVLGQQAGIRIRDFDKARIGDLIESFRTVSREKGRFWQAAGRIVRK